MVVYHVAVGNANAIYNIPIQSHSGSSHIQNGSMCGPVLLVPGGHLCHLLAHNQASQPTDGSQKPEPFHQRCSGLVLDASGSLRCWRLGCESRSSRTARCQTPGSVHCSMASRAFPYLWRHTASPMIPGGRVEYHCTVVCILCSRAETPSRRPFIQKTSHKRPVWGQYCTEVRTGPRPQHMQPRVHTHAAGATSSGDDDSCPYRTEVGVPTR